MNSYALFLGCTIPAREPSYEVSARKALKALGVELNDMKGSTCCAPIPIESLDYMTSLSTAAYNVALAEEMNMDMVTLCNGCFQNLCRTNEVLKKDGHLREKVNEILVDTGKRFRGTKNVYHYLQVLNRDVGRDSIKKSVSRSLKALKVAPFYGSHLLKPSEILRFDEFEDPHVLDDLIAATGAQPVQYLYKNRCCGGLLRGTADDLAVGIARKVISSAVKSKADCMTTVCPFCWLQLDTGQLEIRRTFNETYNIPILHYPELLCLALGIEPKELGLQTHRVRVDSILQKIA
jgi:heterodisulfide reductase subunit B